MRKTIDPQMKLGEVNIAKITFDPKSRDDIPQILRGLQSLYCNSVIREKVFAILEKHMLSNIDPNNGRPGMPLWHILVMGVLRLDLNWDYDRLQEQVKNHKQIREMLGFSSFIDKEEYSLQRLKDNVKLLTPELLNEINQVVVEAGHDIVKKKDGEVLHGRCDSFVVENNVHFPTDISLLYDAMRVAIRLIVDLSKKYKLTTWRQHRLQLKNLKKKVRAAQQKSRKKKSSEEEVANAYKQLLLGAEELIQKINSTLVEIETTVSNEKNLFTTKSYNKAKEKIKIYISHAERQIDQTRRRVIYGEVIPHDEKVLSIFEPHTEWISKGKPGVPVELGHRVSIVEDQYGFILNHVVHEKETDDQVAVPIVEETKNKFASFATCSFDKGYHSPSNQKIISEMLEELIMPKKGRLSKKDKERESTESFKKRKRKHSAVESAINALEVHGLDRCPDKGIEGFKRYVSLAVVARNIQIIGAVILKKELRQLQRKHKKKEADYKQAA